MNKFCSSLSNWNVRDPLVYTVACSCDPLVYTVANSWMFSSLTVTNFRVECKQ